MLCETINSVRGNRMQNLSTRKPCSEGSICRLILVSPVKSCALDPIPTFLFKELVDGLWPYVTVMINSSPGEGQQPKYQKHAILTPISKKPGLSLDNEKSYRPVSNLTFISKAQRLRLCISTRHRRMLNRSQHFWRAYRQPIDNGWPRYFHQQEIFPSVTPTVGGQEMTDPGRNQDAGSSFHQQQTWLLQRCILWYQRLSVFKTTTYQKRSCRPGDSDEKVRP